MTFNSLAFGLFLPAVTITHWLLPHRFRLHLIVAASYLFYGAWDWRFLGLIWVSTAVDFLVGKALGSAEEPARRKQLLWLSIGVNLGILGFFKYFNFFTESASYLANRAGIDLDPVTLKILLPVGISFYTFQTMSYSIDVYRGRIAPCQQPLLFAAYVAFFPQLVAGPIERAERLLPQLAAIRTRPSSRQVESSLSLILLGLVKKVFVADQMAPLVNRVFSNPGQYDRWAIIAAAFSFSIQIYMDFSAYTDIARGASRLLGVELMENFREPFLATNISELWRRWHISLTTWLRDYVYIPLGSDGTNVARRDVALFLTFLASGLWHGAGMTFVAFGVLNGTYLILHRRIRRFRPPKERRSIPSSILLAAFSTSLFTTTMLLFRADTLSDAWQLVGTLISGGGEQGQSWFFSAFVFGVAATLTLDLIRARGRRLEREPAQQPVLRGALVGLGVAAVLLGSYASPTEFIYFQF